MIAPHPVRFTGMPWRCGACDGWYWIGPEADAKDPIHAVPSPCSKCGTPVTRREYCIPCAPAIVTGTRLGASIPQELEEPGPEEPFDAPRPAGMPHPDPERSRRQSEAIAYIAAYRGTFGLILSLKADPRMGSKWMRLSDRQIDAVLASRDRETQWAQEREAKRAIVATPASDAVTEDGMYLDAEGVIWKVQAAKASGSGNLYAKRLDPADGSFTYTPGAIRRLRASQRMTLEQAKRFGALYGFCIRCGRTLTDEYSIANGIGKVCAGRL